MIKYRRDHAEEESSVEEGMCFEVDSFEHARCLTQREKRDDTFVLISE